MNMNKTLALHYKGFYMGTFTWRERLSSARRDHFKAKQSLGH